MLSATRVTLLMMAGVVAPVVVNAQPPKPGTGSAPVVLGVGTAFDTLGSSDVAPPPPAPPPPPPPRRGYSAANDKRLAPIAADASALGDILATTRRAVAASDSPAEKRRLTQTARAEVVAASRRLGAVSRANVTYTREERESLDFLANGYRKIIEQLDLLVPRTKR